jgi:hypothetical protein
VAGRGEALAIRERTPARATEREVVVVTAVLVAGSETELAVRAPADEKRFAQGWPRRLNARRLEEPEDHRHHEVDFAERREVIQPR